MKKRGVFPSALLVLSVALLLTATSTWAGGKAEGQKPEQAIAVTPVIPWTPSTVRAIEPPRFIPVIAGRNGVVCSASSVGPSAGLKALMDGGNAVDAAITTAATITVSEFISSGIGGHGIMMLYWAKTGEVKCLDWGGFLPHKWTLDQLGTPPAAPETESVLNTIMPGTLAGWAEALKQYGTISLAKALEPAIMYAEEGIPADPRIVSTIAGAKDIIPLFPEAARLWMPQGRPPREGELMKFPDLAATYRRIAKEGTDVFYKGDIGDKIVKYLNDNGSRFTKEEFANYKPIWRDTLSNTYRGRYTVHVPKNQNYSPVILTMLNIWENFDMKGLGLFSVEDTHLVIEAMKVALADRITYYGDPDFVKVPYDVLISKEYAKRIAQRIDMKKATSPDKPGDISISMEQTEENGEVTTTNIAVVDKDHNVCVITQTLGSSLGCKHIVPGTGITLNNEGQFFDLKPVNGTNYPAAGKRVENQMGPAIVLKDGKIHMGVGTPGGTMIPQAIALVIQRMIDHGYRIQDAIELPRIRYRENGWTEIERGVPWPVLEKLWQMGHRIRVPSGLCGISGVTIDTDTGVMQGGAEPSRNYTRVAY